MLVQGTITISRYIECCSGNLYIVFKEGSSPLVNGRILPVTVLDTAYKCKTSTDYTLEYEDSLLEDPSYTLDVSDMEYIGCKSYDMEYTDQETACSNILSCINIEAPLDGDGSEENPFKVQISGADDNVLQILSDGLFATFPAPIQSALWNDTTNTIKLVVNTVSGTQDISIPVLDDTGIFLQNYTFQDGNGNSFILQNNDAVTITGAGNVGVDIDGATKSIVITGASSSMLIGDGTNGVPQGSARHINGEGIETIIPIGFTSISPDGSGSYIATYPDGTTQNITIPTPTPPIQSSMGTLANGVVAPIANSNLRRLQHTDGVGSTFNFLQGLNNVVPVGGACGGIGAGKAVVNLSINQNANRLEVESAEIPKSIAGRVVFPTDSNIDITNTGFYNGSPVSVTLVNPNSCYSIGVKAQFNSGFGLNVSTGGSLDMFIVINGAAQIVSNKGTVLSQNGTPLNEDFYLTLTYYTIIPPSGSVSLTMNNLVEVTDAFDAVSILRNSTGSMVYQGVVI